MDTLDGDKVGDFFRRVQEQFPGGPSCKSVVVTHLLPDRPLFLHAVSAVAPIAMIIPKPKSVDSSTYDWLKNRYAIDKIGRFEPAQFGAVLEVIGRRAEGRPIVILDIGGYFASMINWLVANYSGGVVGVVEDTENGLQRYKRLPSVECPIFSVARSPLKEPEDFLVGQSIVFSVEALLREQEDILHGRTACVIGYGKVGRSIAELLHARHVRTVVFDEDFVKLIHARSHGFGVATNLGEALRGAGLVFCATGNLSLSSEAFGYLSSGAYVATVTSSEDELHMEHVKATYAFRHISDFITRFETTGHHFYLLNRGQAVNFLHGAAVGPFIYLVQAEILAAVASLNGRPQPGFHECSASERNRIAKIWCESFSDGVTGGGP